MWQEILTKLVTIHAVTMVMVKLFLCLVKHVTKTLEVQFYTVLISALEGRER
jgi:hypothetical protein